MNEKLKSRIRIATVTALVVFGIIKAIKYGLDIDVVTMVLNLLTEL